MEIRPVKHSLGKLLQSIMKTPTPPHHSLAVESAPLPARSAARSAADSAHTPDVESALLPAHSAAESAPTRTPIAVSALCLELHAVSSCGCGQRFGEHMFSRAPVTVCIEIYLVCATHDAEGFQHISSDSSVLQSFQLWSLQSLRVGFTFQLRK